MYISLRGNSSSLLSNVRPNEEMDSKPPSTVTVVSEFVKPFFQSMDPRHVPLHLQQPDADRPHIEIDVNPKVLSERSVEGLVDHYICVPVFKMLRTLTNDKWGIAATIGCLASCLPGAAADINIIKLYSAVSFERIGKSDGYPLNGHYVLMKDVFMAGNFKSIGSHTHPFTGRFDGNGKTILRLQTPLFVAVGKGGEIINTVFKEAYIAEVLDRPSSGNSPKKLGIVARTALGASFSGLRLIACYVESSHSTGFVVGYCSYDSDKKTSCADGCAVGSLKNISIHESRLITYHASSIAGGVVGDMGFTNVNIEGISLFNVRIYAFGDSAAAGGVVGFWSGGHGSMLSKIQLFGVSVTTFGKQSACGGVAGVSLQQNFHDILCCDVKLTAEGDHSTVSFGFGKGQFSYFSTPLRRIHLMVYNSQATAKGDHSLAGSVSGCCAPHQTKRSTVCKEYYINPTNLTVATGYRCFPHKELNSTICNTRFENRTNSYIVTDDGCGHDTPCQIFEIEFTTPATTMNAPVSTIIAHGNTPGTLLNTTTTSSGTKAMIPAGTKTITPTGTKTIIPAGTKTITPTGTKTIIPAGTKTITPAGTKTITPAGTKTITPAGSKTITPAGTKTITSSSTTSNPADKTLAPVEVMPIGLSSTPILAIAITAGCYAGAAVVTCVAGCWLWGHYKKGKRGMELACYPFACLRSLCCSGTQQLQPVTTEAPFNVRPQETLEMQEIATTDTRAHGKQESAGSREQACQQWQPVPTEEFIDIEETTFGEFGITPDAESEPVSIEVHLNESSTGNEQVAMETINKDVTSDAKEDALVPTIVPAKAFKPFRSRPLSGPITQVKWQKTQTNQKPPRGATGSGL